jgi:hypothetical protein
MFETTVTQFLTADVLFGFVGALLVTPFLAQFFISVLGPGRETLPKSKKIACGFLAAFLVAISWDLRDGSVNWAVLPSQVIGYTFASTWVYQSFLKPYLEKKAKE